MSRMYIDICRAEQNSALFFCSQAVHVVQFPDLTSLYIYNLHTVGTCIYILETPKLGTHCMTNAQPVFGLLSPRHILLTYA